MYITKCDKCGKKKTAKNRNEWINISISGRDFGYQILDFCAECGKKALDIFKKNVKIEKDKL